MQEMPKPLQPADILNPGSFSPVILREQFSCDVGHRLRGKLHLAQNNWGEAARIQYVGWLKRPGARAEGSVLIEFTSVGTV
jgi:hypothetical protein